MIYGRIERSGDEYLVRIPAAEVEGRGFVDGDLVIVEMRGATDYPKLSQRLQESAERNWQEHEGVYRGLADLSAKGNAE